MFIVSELGRIYAQLPLKEMEVKHSIDRPYIRPIIRGKENKRVEFGAKVNNIQIDEISFIEHHYFEAFNEGVRLKECIEYQQELTGTKVTRVGADTIYANNENRRYCRVIQLMAHLPGKVCFNQCMQLFYREVGSTCFFNLCISCFVF